MNSCNLGRNSWAIFAKRASSRCPTCFETAHTTSVICAPKFLSPALCHNGLISSGTTTPGGVVTITDVGGGGGGGSIGEGSTGEGATENADLDNRAFTCLVSGAVKHTVERIFVVGVSASVVQMCGITVNMPSASWGLSMPSSWVAVAASVATIGAAPSSSLSNDWKVSLPLVVSAMLVDPASIAGAVEVEMVEVEIVEVEMVVGAIAGSGVTETVSTGVCTSPNHTADGGGRTVGMVAIWCSCATSGIGTTEAKSAFTA